MTNYIGRGPLGEIENILRDVLTTQPLKYKGVWQQDTYYDQFDVIQYTNNVYVVVSSHRSSSVFTDNIEKYDKISSSFEPGQAYNATTVYVPGNTVQFNGAVYLAIDESIGIDPTNVSHWTQVISDLGRQQSNLVTITGGSISGVDISVDSVTSDLIPDTDITHDLGSNSRRFRDLYLSGNTITLGDITISKSDDSEIDGIDIGFQNGENVLISNKGVSAGSINTENGAVFAEPNATLVLGDETNLGVQLIGDTEVTGNLDIVGNLSLGGDIVFGDSSSDTVAFNANFSSSISPDTDNTYDIGSASFSWRDVYATGIISNTDTLTYKSTSNIDADSSSISLYASPNDITLGNSAEIISLGASNSTTTIKNNLEIDNDLNVLGNLVSNLIPSDNAVIDIGSDISRYRDLYTENLDTLNISITNNNITVKSTDTNLVLQPNGLGSVVINGTTALAVPKGTQNERSLFSPEIGSIRFNTDIAQFEGYQGTVWTSLGGVKSVDGETFITAELNPGDGDDTLRFFTDNNPVAALGTEQFALDTTIDFVINSTSQSTSAETGAIVVSGGAGIAQNLNVGGNLNVGADTVITGNLVVNGTTTTINSTTLSVDDKNIELASVENPTDSSANGAGITVKGSVDKTINYVNATDSFAISENIDLASNKFFAINSKQVLTSSSVFPTQSTVSFAPGATQINIGASNSGTLNLRNELVSVVDRLEAAGNFKVSDKFTVDSITGDVTTNGNVNATDGSFNTVVITGASSGNITLQATEDALGTLTLPAATDTLLGKNTTDTVTNKTIDLTDNSLSGTVAEFNSALSDDNFATLTGAETLTNKTLTDPIINATNGAFVFPASSSPSQTNEGEAVWDSDSEFLTVGTGSSRKTLVDIDSAQTLTNKTLTSPTITGVSPTITLEGDLGGSVTLTDLGSATLTATIQADSVALGTDTTGNYVEDITGTANQITVSGSGSESSSVTLSLPQDIHTGASPNFAGAALDNIQIGITGANEIDTSAGNLIIDSAGGQTTIDDDLVVSGNLTISGTTTTLNSTTVSVDDKNIELGATATPTDITADGGGITLKGTIDKTINWLNSTDSWTSSENFELELNKSFRINGASVLNATTLGSGVINSSLTSVGTISSGTWQGSVIAPTYGGTGINNGTNTINLGGANYSITTTASGQNLTFNLSNNTQLSLPSSGTVATTGDLSQFAPTTSAQLAGVISDETGSGSLVFSNSPSFFKPILGNASATTINNVTITEPSNNSTITILDDKTLTVNNTLLLKGTDASEINFTGGGTVAYIEDTLSVFADTTSAELRTVISDTSGSGNLLFGNSPTINNAITTNSASFNLINSNVNSVNFATSASEINIGSNTGTTTIGNSLIISGNLTVNGTTTTVNSTTLSVDDKNIELGKTDNPTDASADGGGITLKGSTDKTFLYNNLTNNWSSSENINIASDKTFNVGDEIVLSDNSALPAANTADIAASATTVSIGSSSGNTNINNNLNVTGSSLLSSDLSVAGAVDINSSLDLSGTATFTNTTESTSATTGAVTVAGGIGINGNSNIQGNASIGGTFDAGDSVLNSLDVTNNVSISGNLDIDGSFTVNTDKLTIDSTNGNTNILGSLETSSAVTFLDTLDVSSSVTFGSDFEVTESAIFNDNVILNGSSTEAEVLFKIGNNVVDNFVVDSATGNTDIQGTFSVASAAEFSDTISVTNQATLGTLSASSASFSDQITSTLSDGTAPFNITSTTLVSNLNADKVDGYDVAESASINTVVARDATGEIDVLSVNFIGSNDGNTVLEANATASGVLTLPAVTDVLVGKSTADTFANKTINLANNNISGTTAEFNTALSDNDFATVAGAETLSNKTIDLTENTLSGTLAEFNTALSNDDFVSLTGEETLANKTLNDPTINGENGILVLPTSASPEQTTQASVVYNTTDNVISVGSGTNRNILVDTDSSQTLTNKTITSPTITGVSPTLTLSGDVSGTATFTDLGDVTLTTTVEENSVSLGTDTTGDYIQNLVQGTGVTISNNSGEGSTPTVEIGQNVATDQTVTFAGVTAGNISVGVAGNNTVTTSSGSLIIDSSDGTTNIDDDLIVTGNLTVQGTTTTVDSTVSTIVDPIISLGGTSGGGEATSDDGKDRGINFKWNNGAEQNGFFGFDNSTGYFTFVPQATISSEVVSGDKGDVEAARFRGNLIGSTATLTNALSVNGTVSLSPGASHAFSVNPVNTGSIDNVNIGATTAATGDFTDVTVSGTTALTGLLTANGGIEVQSTAFTLDTAGNTGIGGELSVTGTVSLTEQLTVPNGGTGITTATVNGIFYGNGTGSFGFTAESDPGGNNANDSNGILTTDASNVPVWTDTIDGGTF